MSQHSFQLISPTGRIRLVPPRITDDEAVASLRSHSRTLQYLRFLPNKVTIEDARARRESRAESSQIVDFHLHVMNGDGSSSFGGVTGIFNIDETNKSCEAGILVAPELHREGFGTEALYCVLKFAFQDRQMHRVTFETAENNVAMCTWLEKVLEATLEGTRRECWNEGDGKYTTARSYSILEWEWSRRIQEKLEKLVLRTA